MNTAELKWEVRRQRMEGDILRLVNELASKEWSKTDPWRQLYSEHKALQEQYGCNNCKLGYKKACTALTLLHMTNQLVDTLWGDSQTFHAEVLDMENSFEHQTGYANIVLEYFGDNAMLVGAFSIGLQVATILQKFEQMEVEDKEKLNGND